MIPRAKFHRLAHDTFKELVQETSNGLTCRLGQDAVLALQVAMEASLEVLMADALKMCEHSSHQTAHVQDMSAVVLFC